MLSPEMDNPGEQARAGEVVQEDGLCAHNTDNSSGLQAISAKPELKPPDPKTIMRSSLAFLHPECAVFELCIIGPKAPKSTAWEGYAGGKKPIVAGWFKNPDKAAALAAQIQATGVYVTLNPCQEALLGRANERLVAGVPRTQDKEIVRIMNLLVDLDPIRPEGISSSDLDHEAALEMAQIIRADLENEGWPAPLVGDSGNGAHLIYSLDLPRDEDTPALLKAVLIGLAHRYADQLAHLHLELDQVVFNPARLTKLYGTWARKGEDTADRPHRRARIISLPEARQPVPRELLERISQESIAQEVRKQDAPRDKGNGGADGFDLAAYLNHYNVDVVKVKPYAGGWLYCLEQCLFDPSHNGNEAAIGQAADGIIYYQCFHNSCKERTWGEARQIISGAAKLGEFISGHRGGDAQGGKEPAPTAAQEDKPKPIQATTTSFLPLPPAFPLDVFPPIYQQALHEVQEAFGVPMEIPACALLSVGGTCIGRTRGVLIKNGWIEHGNLWLAIVGASGIGKSPCVRAIFRPIFETEKRWYAEYQEAHKQYQYELDQRHTCHKKERAELPPPPTPPVWNQLFVDDATTEALTDALAGNPRGILWNRDELSGLILDLDKYTGKDGGTKSRMMSAYDSGLWKVNRKDNSKKALIPNATLSIFGTIQPKALPTIFSNLDAATGFLPRFIFVAAVQETPPLWTDKTVSERSAQDLSHLVEGLLQFELNEAGEPLIIGISREAQALYHDWFNEKVMAPWRNTEAEIYEAVLAKLRGQALRICLILHCMESVANNKSELAPVSADTMRKALRLADYFEIHQRNAWQTIITEGAAATLTPMQRQVVTAILNLESEIRGGLISTARVTAEINRRGDERFALSADTVGRVAACLGLKTRHLPGETGRGIAVGPTDIEKFKNIFRISGLSGLSGSTPDSARGCGCNPSGSQVVQVVRTDEEPNHLDHLPTTTLTPANIDGVKATTTKTTCTTSPKVISQETMAAWDEAIVQVVGEAVQALNPDEDLKEMML